MSIMGNEWKLHLVPPTLRRNLLFSDNILEFYFDVSDKDHPVSRVYLPKVEDLNPTWLSFCPPSALRRLWAHRLLTPDTVSEQFLVESEVVSAMKFIDSNKRDFQTQSLRIGGHTFSFSGSAGLKDPVIYAVRFFDFARCRKMDDLILALDKVGPMGSYKFV